MARTVRPGAAALLAVRGVQCGLHAGAAGVSRRHRAGARHAAAVALVVGGIFRDRPAARRRHLPQSRLDAARRAARSIARRHPGCRHPTPPMDRARGVLVDAVARRGQLPQPATGARSAPLGGAVDALSVELRPGLRVGGLVPPAAVPLAAARRLARDRVAYRTRGSGRRRPARRSPAHPRRPLRALPFLPRRACAHQAGRPPELAGCSST